MSFNLNWKEVIENIKKSKSTNVKDSILSYYYEIGKLTNNSSSESDKKELSIKVDLLLNYISENIEEIVSLSDENLNRNIKIFFHNAFKLNKIKGIDVFENNKLTEYMNLLVKNNLVNILDIIYLNYKTQKNYPFKDEDIDIEYMKKYDVNFGLYVLSKRKDLAQNENLLKTLMSQTNKTEELALLLNSFTIDFYKKIKILEDKNISSLYLSDVFEKIDFESNVKDFLNNFRNVNHDSLSRSFIRKLLSYDKIYINDQKDIVKEKIKDIRANIKNKFEELELLLGKNKSLYLETDENIENISIDVLRNLNLNFINKKNRNINNDQEDLVKNISYLIAYIDKEFDGEILKNSYKIKEEFDFLIENFDIKECEEVFYEILNQQRYVLKNMFEIKQVLSKLFDNASKKDDFNNYNTEIIKELIEEKNKLKRAEEELSKLNKRKSFDIINNFFDLMCIKENINMLNEKVLLDVLKEKFKNNDLKENFIIINDLDLKISEKISLFEDIIEEFFYTSSNYKFETEYVTYFLTKELNKDINVIKENIERELDSNIMTLNILTKKIENQKFDSKYVFSEKYMIDLWDNNRDVLLKLQDDLDWELKSEINDNVENLLLKKINEDIKRQKKKLKDLNKDGLENNYLKIIKSIEKIDSITLPEKYNKTLINIFSTIYKEKDMNLFSKIYKINKNKLVFDVFKSLKIEGVNENVLMKEIIIDKINDHSLNVKNVIENIDIDVGIIIKNCTTSVFEEIGKIKNININKRHWGNKDFVMKVFSILEDDCNKNSKRNNSLIEAMPDDVKNVIYYLSSNNIDGWSNVINEAWLFQEIASKNKDEAPKRVKKKI